MTISKRVRFSPSRTPLEALLGLACAMLALLGVAGLAGADEHAPAEAEAFFGRYQQLNAAFDPAIADLFADEARIISTQRLPDGKPGRKLTIRGIDYKPMLRGAMSGRRERDDVTSFSDVRVESEGDRVRIRCTRRVERRYFDSPYSLLVGPDETGQWLIYEEVSETLAK